MYKVNILQFYLKADMIYYELFSVFIRVYIKHIMVPFIYVLLIKQLYKVITIHKLKNI